MIGSARIGGVVMIFGLLAGSALGQEPKEVIANGGLLHTLEAEPVLGQPYSAVQVRNRKQTLIDGTNLAHAAEHRVARDAAGRVRVEQPCGCAPGHEQTVRVYVLDPVAHTLTTWQTGGSGEKVAMLFKLPAEKPQEARPQAVPDTGRPQPVVTTEDLGTDVMAGVEVRVTKTTTIVPVGRSHNDAPITKTHEVWTSPEMKLTLKEQWEDPRTGMRTVALDQLSRTEPDAAMFHAPSGYKVKDLKQTLKELADRLETLQANL